ncbi:MULTISPECIES: helix-turn-helix domain-containing protein [Bacillus]|uniref:helix-turn-helix domain-containing protein n=1 Tax=Bacillus TaxID=1386 RepID=UPI0019133FA9|nr:MULTISPECIES: helix-turn-helix transcriptional regulator [Bacillus]MBK5489734.1 helix-turn-helix transcriptional regulator [Bacillus sp. TH17]
MDDLMHGEQIKLIRMILDISQREFAERLSVTQAQVSRWELGVYKPSRASIAKINQLVGVDNVRLIDSLVYSLTLHSAKEGIRESYEFNTKGSDQNDEVN